MELHFHLLPGVDDGPRNYREALVLARRAVADGTRRVVVTPHAAFVEPSELRGRTAELGEVLRGTGVPLAVLAGAECLADDVVRLTADELELVAQGPPGRRWLLMEAPFEGDLTAVPDALAKLSRLGLGVLIAHPERCAGWWIEKTALDAACAAGARLQVNASSLTGAHGPEARRRALTLVRARRAAVLASDAHGDARPPCLREALAVLAHEGIPGEPLVRERPAALLATGLPTLQPLPLAA